MKQEFEKKYFAAADCGLNADDVDIAVGENQWVNLVDARVGTTDNGVTGVVESIGGTRTLTSPQPSITFINIGSAVDTARNRFFYFQYNKYTNEHRIYCYQADTDEILTVLSASQVTGGLGFNKNYLITNARVVGDMLYWTDNLNEPRRINVEAALKLNNPSYNTDVEPYTSPLAQSVIKLIRRPPGRVLGTNLITEVGRPNFLRSFSGQFAIRYIYRDGEISVVGPPSTMVNYRFDITNPSGVVSDTNNAIDIDINTPALDGEYIEQDVQIVQYLVRYDNQPEYFVIKEWNKSNAADAAAISAYNAGGALSFRFYNDANISALSSADSVKPYDSVPLLSETLELGLSRLFLGNNKIGYDTPSTTSLTAAPSAGTLVSMGTEIWKSYSSYQLGIRFRDNEKRSSGVVTNDSLVVRIPDRGDYNDNSFVEYINFTLNNTNALVEIPDWAYYYDILITKNLRTRFFAQWLPNSVKYVNKNSDGTFTYTNSYSSLVYGIAFGTAYLNSQGMGVVYTEGDIVRVYTNGLSPAPFDLNVIAQDADYIICRPYDLGAANLISGIFVEYYVPYKQSGNEIFYTTSASYRVYAPTTDMRQYTTLSGQLEGDVFFISRVTPVLPATYYTECMSPNDNYWKNWYDIYGEANIVTLLGQVQKTSSVKWSNTLIEGSLVNGLSTFDALDEKLLPQSMGPLRKLQQASKVQQQGNIMLAIGEDETASLYLGEVQVVGSDANAFLASSPNVIGTVNVLKGSFGTTHPESVTEYRGNVYWWDDVNARIVQYSTGGLYPISNYKMTRYWKQFTDTFKSLTTAQIEALDIFNRPFVFTTVDPYHDELLISVPKLLSTPPKGYLPDYPDVIYPFDIWDGQSKVLVFKVGTNPNFWQGSYSFSSEGFVTLGSNLYSFKYGQVFIHNQPNVNQFYDDIQRYKPKIMAVFNKDGNLPKVYNAIKVEGNLVPTFTYFRSESPYVQASDLMDFDYTNYEGMLYATLYRNKIVPTASGYTTDGLITAEKVRTNALRVMLEFTVIDQPLQLRYATMEYILSKGHLI